MREDKVGMVLFNMVLPAKVVSEQRPEEREEVSHTDTQWKSGTGRRNSKCEGPGAGAHLVY